MLCCWFIKRLSAEVPAFQIKSFALLMDKLIIHLINEGNCHNSPSITRVSKKTGKMFDHFKLFIGHPVKVIYINTYICNYTWLIFILNTSFA